MAVPRRVMGSAQVDSLAVWTDHPKRPEVDFDGLAEVEDDLRRGRQEYRRRIWLGAFQLGVRARRAGNANHRDQDHQRPARRSGRGSSHLSQIRSTGLRRPLATRTATPITLPAERIRATIANVSAVVVLDPVAWRDPPVREVFDPLVPDVSVRIGAGVSGLGSWDVTSWIHRTISPEE